MIRVLHVTEDHSVRNTGISAAVDAMIRSVPPEVQPSLACVGTDTIPLPEGLAVQKFSVKGLEKIWRFSPGQTQVLTNLIKDVDVVHVHGLWMWIQWAAARQANTLALPVVVTPHGMLEPWIWSRQSLPNQWKKKIYWQGLAYPAFRKARMIHALTTKEANTMAGYFPGQMVKIIPHGIDLTPIDEALSNPESQKPGGTRYFLFLGRFHPVKAIHILIQAFARLKDRSMQLRIAGYVEQRELGYAISLRELVKDLGMEERVLFTGPVYGEDKWKLYHHAWAACLPSFSEGLSMVSLEAAATGTPVITSFESGMDVEWDQSGGMRLKPTEDSILQGLEQSSGWTTKEQQEHGRAMRRLIENRYSRQRVGEQWAETYRSLANGDKHA